MATLIAEKWLAVTKNVKMAQNFMSFLATLSPPLCVSTQGKADEAGGLEAVTSGFLLDVAVSCKDPFGRYRCAANACSTASQIASVHAVHAIHVSKHHSLQKQLNQHWLVFACI